MATAYEVGTLETLWATKLKQLHGLAVSIGVERQRGNEVGVQAMREVFVRIVAEMQAISERIKVQDGALDWVEQFLLQVDSGARNLGSFGLGAWRELKPLIYVVLALAALHYLSPVIKRVSR